MSAMARKSIFLNIGLKGLSFHVKHSSAFMKRTYFSVILATGLLMAACGGSDKPSGQADVVDQALAQPDTATNALPSEVVQQLLQSIPSPVETSNLIKQTGSRYNPDYLNPVGRANDYTSSVKQALNLGIYGADLGYTNIYEQNQDAIAYTEAVKRMADGLQIGQYFDFETIKRLATNRSNLDSLLNITQQNMEKINHHLQEKQRSHLSLLIITGGWVEGLHLTCNVLQQGDNQRLKERIGEQKDIIGNLVVLYESYQTQPGFSDIYKELNQLNQVYQNIKVVEEKRGEPKMVIKDGIPMLEDSRVTTVYVRDEQIKEIAGAASRLRSKFIEI